jgi:hypothetical protein
MPFKMSLNAVSNRVALLPRERGWEKLHYPRIGVQSGKRDAIVRYPPPEQQPSCPKLPW